MEAFRQQACLVVLHADPEIEPSLELKHRQRVSGSLGAGRGDKAVVYTDEAVQSLQKKCGIGLQILQAKDQKVLVSEQMLPILDKIAIQGRSLYSRTFKGTVPAGRNPFTKILLERQCTPFLNVLVPYRIHVGVKFTHNYKGADPTEGFYGQVGGQSCAIPSSHVSCQDFMAEYSCMSSGLTVPVWLSPQICQKVISIISKLIIPVFVKGSLVLLKKEGNLWMSR